MKRLLLRVALALWTVGLAMAVSAQSGSQPVYAYMRGNLWRFDLETGASAQLTTWGYSGGPILSPDGAKLAFLSTSPGFIEQWEAGTATQSGGTPSADIIVMDLASETFTRIADQTGASPAGYLRSLPVWSPDGTRLAWIELDPQRQPISAARLQIYDAQTGARTEFGQPLDLGIQGADIHMPSLRWGGGGLARLLYINKSKSAEPALLVQFIDIASGELTQVDLGLNASRSNSVRDFIWVNHLGASKLALQIQDYWELLDPADGSRSRLLDPPRLKNRGIAGAIQLIPASVANGRGDWDMHWYATSGANLYHTGYESPRVNRNYLPAISPEGARMAWHNGDHIGGWQIGLADADPVMASDASHRRAFPIPEPVSVVWAPTEWITTGAVVGAVAGSYSVNCVMTPLLSAGQTAIVTGDTTLKIRSEATISGSQLGKVEGGAGLSIAAGPICADGYNWYAVYNDVLAGWSAEGGDGQYWLLYHVDCSASPPTRLTAGMSATVAGEQVVNIRSGPGAAETQIIWAVAAGEEFRITGLPQCGAEGLRWYPVRVNEISGYIAEGQGETYWIAPVADWSTQ